MIGNFFHFPHVCSAENLAKRVLLLTLNGKRNKKRKTSY